MLGFARWGQMLPLPLPCAPVTSAVPLVPVSHGLLPQRTVSPGRVGTCVPYHLTLTWAWDSHNHSSHPSEHSSGSAPLKLRSETLVLPTVC